MTQNTMQYLGYTAAIQFEDEDGLFYGDVLDLRDVITFSGASVEELRKAFRQAVDDYIAYCEGKGVAPEKPFSGRFVLRLEPSTHRDAAIAAASARVSLNAFIVRCVERELVSTPGARAVVPNTANQTVSAFIELRDVRYAALGVPETARSPLMTIGEASRLPIQYRGGKGVATA